MIAGVPIFPELELNGTFLGIWLAHTAFGLPLAVYLLRNFIGSLPSSIIESARVDGADHFTIFWRLVVPLSVPALAAFAIFQFLWVWNDLLVARIFLGGTDETQVLTLALNDLNGTRNEDWHLLTAAAFISMLLPLAVFFALQRYFIRGLTAGAVKG
jgi:alpha-glucoside transport system permease protein